MYWIFRNPLMLAVAALILLILTSSIFFVVPETSQAVIVRFGNPVGIINRYRSNEDFGHTGAGLRARIPFVDQVVWIDKRVQSIEMERQQVLSTDQLRLQVDAFARYRIVDPLQMYIAAQTENNVSEALKPILGSALRNELGKRPFAALLSPERSQIMDNIQASLNLKARQYGAEIVDVRLKRADLPDGTPLDSAYNRMKTARFQQAAAIRAKGNKQAQIIQAEAEANAARIYADSFGKDPAFYDFYRAMLSYRYTFDPQAKGQTSIILSPDNDFLRQFRGR